MISHVGSPLGTFVIPIANSAGHSAYENPINGTATWTGIVGAHTYAGDHVEGDADLTVNFVATEMDVGFTGMMSESGTSYAGMSWRNLAMENGGFASGGPVNRMEGRFYGPNHEEVGGIFGSAGMVGGFHTIRDKQ